MLGISSGLTSVSAPSSRVLLETYTADWSSDADGWVSYASNDAAATLTHGTTFEGKSNTLRVQFNADETGLAGIQLATPLSTTIRKGDYLEVTYDIYLDSAYDSLTDLWDGTDTVSTSLQFPGAQTDGTLVTQNEWVSVSTVLVDNDSDLAMSSAKNTLIYFNNSNDRPNNGARFYVHNFVMKLYRSALFT